MAGRQVCWKINTATREVAEKILHKTLYATFDCRSLIETSPASPIEMSRSSVCVRLVGVAWDDGDHDEPQRADAPAGADRCCRRTPVGRRRDRTYWRRAKTDLPTAASLPCWWCGRSGFPQARRTEQSGSGFSVPRDRAGHRA